jgi:hypothetical protein
METAETWMEDTRAQARSPNAAAPEPVAALRGRFETEEFGVFMRLIMPKKQRRGKLYTGFPTSAGDRGLCVGNVFIRVY